MHHTEILVPVTRHYHWLVEPVIYLHRKYFDGPITFLSDRPIPGSQVIEAFPLDMKIFKSQAEHVGVLLKAALHKIDKPLVIISMTDLLPARPVNMDAFRELEKYMVDHPNVARGNLFAGSNRFMFLLLLGRNSQLLHRTPLLDIRTVPSNNTSRIAQMGSTSLFQGVWNREFLLEFIEDGWYLDSIEVPGQWKFMEQDKWHSIVTIPPLVDTSHLCFTAQPNLVVLSAIKNDEDRAFVSKFVPEGFEVA